MKMVSFEDCVISIKTDGTITFGFPPTPISIEFRTDSFRLDRERLKTRSVRLLVLELKAIQ